jgi:hypothetical protein
VRSIVAGLDKEAWHAPVVASGWTVAGMVEHLGNVERHWFLEAVAGFQVDLRWDEGRRSTIHRRPLPAIARRPPCSAATASSATGPTSYSSASA